MYKESLISKQILHTIHTTNKIIYVYRLRERELKLQTDLIIASRELNSLRDNLEQREYLPE